MEHWLEPVLPAADSESEGDVDQGPANYWSMRVRWSKLTVYDACELFTDPYVVWKMEESKKKPHRHWTVLDTIHAGLFVFQHSQLLDNINQRSEASAKWVACTHWTWPTLRLHLASRGPDGVLTSKSWRRLIRDVRCRTQEEEKEHERREERKKDRDACLSRLREY